MLGGAEATGQPNDTAVYYVAGDVQSQPKGASAHRRGLGALAFMTLAPGYFWSDALFPPGWCATPDRKTPFAWNS